MIVYDDSSTEPVRIFDAGADAPTPKTFGEYRLTYRTGDIVSPKVSVTEPLSLELADFCWAVRNGAEPRCLRLRLGLDVCGSQRPLIVPSHLVDIQSESRRGMA